MDAPIELKYYLDDPNSDQAIAECKRVAQNFQRTGALVVRDPRVSFEDSNEFLNIVEKYFEQGTQQKIKDSRPELHYQVGVTPEGTEKPRCTVDPNCQKIVSKLEGYNKPSIPTGSDVKWRYFYKIGERPKSTSFERFNADNVIPEAFQNTWAPTMESWGNKLVATGIILSEMVAIGFGLPKNTFTNLLHCAPHLLAPTGSNLEIYGKLGQILAGFHQDLNFITVHGKSRYPGLHIWLRNGTKIPVSIPDGCLLAQAGMELEYLTAGAVTAGFHEVVVTEKTLEAIERARQNSASLWRISSTVFIHVAPDQTLKPLVKVNSETNVLQRMATDSEQNNEYPPILAGDFVTNELRFIRLGLHD